MDIPPLHRPSLDEAAFHNAISESAEQWFAACLRITRDRDLAQDAVQDGLLNAWHKRGQFQHDAELATWIHRIVINAALQLLRSRGRHVWGEETGEMVDTQPGPEAAAASDQFSKDLNRHLRRLTPIERLCFLLRHFEQWRLKEIAAEIGASEGIVKQAVFRAVRKMRADMGALRRQA